MTIGYKNNIKCEKKKKNNEPQFIQIEKKKL